MKRGFDIRIIIVILLIFIVGFSLFDVFNEKISKKEISGGVVSEQDIAQNTDKGLELKQLTDQLNNLNNNLKVASVQTRGSLSNNLAQVSKQRKELMLDLIEKNPEIVLKNALKQEVIDSMPDEIKVDLEKRVSKQGSLEVLIEDDFENNKSKTYYYLNENGKRNSLHFADVEPFGLISGTKVKLSGLQIDDKIALYKNPTDEWHTLEVLSVPDLKEFNLGEQKTIVILARFLDDAAPSSTLDEIENAIFNDLDSVNEFYKRVSYGRAWLTGNVVGWIVLDRIDQCNIGEIILEEIIEKTDSYIYFPDYKRVIIIFPNGNYCVGRSFATLGPIQVYSSDGSSTASVSWISHDDTSTIFRGWNIIKSVISHELGHNFGTNHAKSYECENAVISNYQVCNLHEYGDFFDVMGNSYTSRQQNSYFREIYGWLYDSNKIVVTMAGKYIIYPITSEIDNKRFVDLPLKKDIIYSTFEYIYNGQLITVDQTISSFFLEYRIPAEFDSFINEIDHQGLILRAGRLKNKWPDKIEESLGTLLLDTTPESIVDNTYDFKDSILTLGKTFYDPYNKISITPTRLTDDGGIEIEISFNKFYVQNNIGDNVASFDMLGNVALKGTCSVSSNCIAPTDSFIFKNSAGDIVAYVGPTGYLCIETGDCSSSPSCSATGNDEFIMQDETGKVVSKIDLTNGDLCYTGSLIQNGSP